MRSAAKCQAIHKWAGEPEDEMPVISVLGAFMSIVIYSLQYDTTAS